MKFFTADGNPAKCLYCKDEAIVLMFGLEEDEPMEEGYLCHGHSGLGSIAIALVIVTNDSATPPNWIAELVEIRE